VHAGNDIGVTAGRDVNEERRPTVRAGDIPFEGLNGKRQLVASSFGSSAHDCVLTAPVLAEY